MPYSTLDNAAAAALTHINRQPKAKKKEYIGLIYQDPETGKYLFTEPSDPITGKSGEGKSRGSFEIPEGSLRGIIHNHPSGGSRHRDRLSEGDVTTARQLGVPSFIGVDDRLLKWEPDSGKTRGKHGLAKDVLAEIPLAMLPQRRAPNTVAKR